jgi:nucleoside-diphosphate-sugar epimerase
MTTLVLGASGATGRLVINELLNMEQALRIVVREGSFVASDVQQRPNVEIIYASLIELSDQEMMNLVDGCDSVVSCLGHNLTFKGMYGHPRRLVTDVIQRVCDAIENLKPNNPVKVVLMNTTGNRNKAAGEKVSCAHTMMVGLIRVLVPPHSDNEKAAQYLQQRVDTHSNYIEWVVVRPDSLVDAPTNTAYQLHVSPTRDPIFNAGKTSRINVAHFMAQLLTHPPLWGEWRSQMPVIYNSEQN